MVMKNFAILLRKAKFFWFFGQSVIYFPSAEYNYLLFINIKTYRINFHVIGTNMTNNLATNMDSKSYK